jgi:hypothetical protein
MRISSAAVFALLSLAACQVRDESEQPAAEASARPAEDPNAIACALDGAQRFERVCEVEKTDVDGTLFLTVRHPDGGFRRFEVLKDGHGIAAADGADDAKVAIEGEFLAATVENDRYLFPMTLKGTDAAK